MNKRKLPLFLAWILLFASVFTGCQTVSQNITLPIATEAVSVESETDITQEYETTQETEEDITSEADGESESESSTDDEAEADTVTEDGTYTSKEEVALYLHLYGHLPSNFISKSDAQKLGWESSKGNLWDVADGYSIGGSRFGNYEGILPDEDGRKWYECDINYEGGYRGSERIVYSNDGLIYYTNDHYKTFECLYGEDD